MAKCKKRWNNIGPFKNKIACINCGFVGGLKIILNETNNLIIKGYLENKNYFEFPDMDTSSLTCYCQYCGDIHNYGLQEGLFLDGQIKEL